MSKESFLKKITVRVPHRSAFDKSFKNLLTLPIGTLVPLLCDELPPNSPVDLEIGLEACLPPLASKTFMNVDVRLEAFFCPTRLLYGGYQAWYTGEQLYNANASQYVSVGLPILGVNGNSVNGFMKPGSLADYLGYKFTTSQASGLAGNTTVSNFNIFPFLAYHFIYDQWYRNTQVQNPAFTKPVYSGSAVSNLISELPYTFIASNAQVFALNATMADGVALHQLRQRNFSIDYFTNATPRAQLGNPQGISINTSGASTTLSISSIRTANSMQQWLERNNYAGFRFQDQLRAVYNANLSDGVAYRPLYLGSGVVPIYSKGVYQNAQNLSGGGSIMGNNPFASVGTEYGSAFTDSPVIPLIKNFTTQEPGYVMVMVSVVPRVTYSSGILRQNLRYTTVSSQTDLANPILQNTGNQPINVEELVPTASWSGLQSVFGYVDRYADYMVREDELHGLVRDGESLAAFALQRSFVSATLSSSFLQIPTTYLDQVAAALSGISGYGAWIDSYLHYRVSMPLAPYSIPSLQDPAYEHGQDVTLRRGGSRID